MPNSSLAVVGTGPVARVLGRVLASGALAPDLIVGRSLAGATETATFIGCARPADKVRASTSLADVRGAHAVMIATPDRAIEAVARQLADSGAIHPGMLVFHCAGALDRSILVSCKEQGALTASVHPLTSFADPVMLAERFRGVFCITEGDDAALSLLEPVFAAAGARIQRLSSSVKAAYHAGAVLASGYLVTTLAAALATEQLAGIASDTALEMLAPLIRVSIDNALRVGPVQAMTGPLVRGDDGVVRHHHAVLLRHDPALARCYAALTDYAAQLLGRADPLTGST